MTRLKRTFFLLLLSSLLFITVQAAANTDSTRRQLPSVIEKLDQRVLEGMGKKYEALEAKMAADAEKSLKRLRKTESRLLQKLQQKDSTAAVKLASGIAEKYQGLIQKLQNPLSASKSSKTYLPNLDSLQTGFNLLKEAGTALPTEKLAAVKNVSYRLTALHGQLNNATDITRFMRQRRQELKEQLGKWGFTKNLKRLNRQVYYYQQQVSEYKALLKDPDKLAQKALALLRDNPAFQNFMATNSQLAQLFRLPGNAASSSATPIVGLQIRAATQQLLSQQLQGAGGVDPGQYLQQQMQQAQSQLNSLKDKVNQWGGGSSELEMPDFKPNQQKTKNFWKRMEYGLNIQSQRPNGLLPVTTDMALTVGYKLNDKSTIGIGAGYKLGWGKNIRHIQFTHQGLSLRTHLDIKLKGSFWITGGYELNHLQEFSRLEQLKNLGTWQRSGLMGLSKKYSVGRKKGNLQLLWDFLSYSQVPRTQALKFRVGYVF